MRILVVCYEFPPLGGGGGRVLEGLCRELPPLGHRIDVVTMGYAGLPPRERVGEVELHRVPCLRRDLHVCSLPEAISYLPAALRRVRQLGARTRYDLVHAHFVFPDGLVAYLTRAAVGAPYVITAHGTDVPGYNPHRLRRVHGVLAPAWRRTVRGAAQVVCQSQHLRSLIRAAAPDVEPRIIPNGFDPPRFRTDRPRKPRILAVTRLFERKGVQHLLEALAELSTGWEVVIVGDGPYLPALRAQAQRLALTVSFRGWLDNGSDELRELYETSGLFAFPSQAENFPIVLLEAMAAGLAIVTTSETGCAEVVGDAALLVPPADPRSLRDAVRRLLADGALREALGAAARARVERHFTWQTVARSYAELYAAHARPDSA